MNHRHPASSRIIGLPDAPAAQESCRHIPDGAGRLASDPRSKRPGFLGQRVVRTAQARSPAARAYTLRRCARARAPAGPLALSLALALLVVPEARAAIPLTPPALPGSPTPTQVELDATVEAFTAWASNRPPDGVISGRVFDPRHGHLGISTALLGLHITGPRARAHVELWRGLTPQIIYASETYGGVDWSLLRQANVGARVGQRLFVDAGLFTSPIGYESSLARDNWLWSSALLNFAMPFYLAGARATWTTRGGVALEAGLYGGWNRLQASAIPSTLMVRAFAADAGSSWQVLLSSAPSRPDLGRAGLGGPRAALVEAFYSRALRPGLDFALDVNAGLETWQQGAAAHRAPWFGADLWARLQLGGPWQLATRLGAFLQRGATASRGGQLLGRLWWPSDDTVEAALCLQWQAAGAPALRLELRHDRASDAVFQTPTSSGTGARTTASLGMVYSL